MPSCSIPLTPGGLGVVEIALSGALVGFGAHNAQAVTATLVYRFATLVSAIILGLASVATYNLGRPKAERCRATTAAQTCCRVVEPVGQRKRL